MGKATLARSDPVAGMTSVLSGLMAEPLPDPTTSEARALILGTGTFWAGWGVAVATLFMNGLAVGVVPFLIAFAAGGWLYFRGVFSVAARYEGMTVGQLYLRGLRRPPWKAFRDRAAWSWMQILLPSYFRRAARALGWSEGLVLGVLGALLATDLLLFVWMMATVPSGTRG